MPKLKNLNLEKIAVKAAIAVKDGAEFAFDRASNGKQLIEDKAGDAKYRFDMYRFHPIFQEAIEKMQNDMPQLIRVIEDDKMKDTEACKNAVGFRKIINGMDVMGLFPEVLPEAGVIFYPNEEEPLYYKDPFRNDLYVSLDDYYTYLKEARVNEIETVAQALGAKYLKVEYKVEKSSLFSKDAKAKAKAKAKPKGVGEVKAEAEHQKNTKDYSKIEVLAELTFDGNTTPIVPEIKYLQGVNAIDTLIKMRVNPKSQNQIKSKTYRIECKQLIGLKQNDAVKIDGAIKKMKIESANSMTVVSMAETENKTTLEFTVEF